MFRFVVTLLLLVAHYTQASEWQQQIIVEGLHIPWGMTQVNDNEILISEKSGQVGVLNLSTSQYKPIFEVEDVYAIGQGGLLDIATSPIDRNIIYFTYSTQVGDAVETALAQATYLDGRITGFKPLLVTKSDSNGGRHFGSRITFDEQSVYFSVGDRGERDNGQDRTTHAGSIIRLNFDGSVPHDNPFVNDKNIQPEIWSFGHRNPQGLFYDLASKRLWSIEHGPRGGDEINLIKRGANYGWPITSHGKEYWGPISVGEAKEKQGIESPKKVYVPSIAPSSLVLYRGERYPELKGKLLAGALKLTHINVLTLANNEVIHEERILESLGERIRDIEILDDGSIIFSSDSGKIFRLVKK